MNQITFKPDHIEDYLATVRTGQWFGWSDSNNKIYANLIVHDVDGTKPTEKEYTDGLAALIAEWELENDTLTNLNVEQSIQVLNIEDQLDTIYHSGVAGWKTTIKTIKDKYPKP